MEKQVSLRRNLEQAGHCVDEAITAFTIDADLESTLADIDQARQLLDACFRRIKAMQTSR